MAHIGLGEGSATVMSLSLYEIIVSLYHRPAAAIDPPAVAAPAAAITMDEQTQYKITYKLFFRDFIISVFGTKIAYVDTIIA